MQINFTVYLELLVVTIQHEKKQDNLSETWLTERK